jgi:uncharacterized protein GlcG (DUF336 family)
MTLTTDEARAVMAAAEARAIEIGIPIVVAVLDAGVHLKAFVRMDGAPLASIDIALKKARTAALFGIGSEEVWEYCKPGAPAPTLELTNGGLAPYGGGVPIRIGAELIGAVGVSGGAIVQDLDVAKTAAEALAATTTHV